MSQLSCIDLSASKIECCPFNHLSCVSVLQRGLQNQLFEWFEVTSNWNLTKENFYTQYELLLSKAELPQKLKSIIDFDTVESIKIELRNAFKTNNLDTVSIVAHKLIDGHKIGVHNDYINEQETHRLIVQINPDWNIENGGYLMLFNSADAEDVAKVIKPLNNSAFGFEISDKSYHAVSTVHNFCRYSIVYTFKESKE